MTIMEVTQTKNWRRLAEVMSPYSRDWKGFDPESLVSKDGNILLTDGEDNFALFERVGPSVVEGHYLFSNARGLRAVKVGKALLNYLFSRHEDVSVVEGKTPKYMTGALKLNKHLGFMPVQTITRAGKEYQVVSLTKERFYENE